MAFSRSSASPGPAWSPASCMTSVPSAGMGVSPLSWGAQSLQRFPEAQAGTWEMCNSLFGGFVHFLPLSQQLCFKFVYLLSFFFFFFSVCETIISQTGASASSSSTPFTVSGCRSWRKSGQWTLGPVSPAPPQAVPPAGRSRGQRGAGRGACAAGGGGFGWSLSAVPLLHASSPPELSSLFNNDLTDGCAHSVARLLEHRRNFLALR